MKMAKDAKAEHTDEAWTCIGHCLEVHEAATRCIFHCLEQGGEHAGSAHIRMLMDTAEIARTGADFLLRGSAHRHFTCGVCGKICEHCADACDAIGAGSEHMQRCAEACRRCAESCHAMAAHHAQEKGQKGTRDHAKAGYG